ncbi:LysR family transcriptional regulator ArgP [Vibrio sp. JPW-9-11-11]|uniref:LysR family transcriptional regulator ArgP n=1 Tax=Vibrio sp. JPW-9-11-11 TaxID=1416532 RepID=UPI001594C9D4|nr:LysR family transcriptional regulator ArgP [Vibrio sp. JPW-9-11-11]NVD05624.1 LysR family transcriptional regulator ArgP [Vibrio sp. JPW-9-11-11]
MRGLDYRWIEALEAVVKAGSFERAAQSLYVSQSAISQRVKQLEKFLAQPVLVREQPPRPTLIGQKLLGFYQRVQLLETELIPELGSDSQEKVQRISIATNADSLATWLLPALAPIMKSHRVEFNFVVFPEARTLNKLKNGEVVGALSMEPRAMAGCEAQYLGRMDYVCVSSPEFAEHYFPNGVDRAALQSAPAVSFDHYDPLHRDFLTQHFHIEPDTIAHHHVASSEAFVNLALMGCAYCLIPKLQIERELASGQLVDLMPGFFMSFEIYWHHWQLETGLLKTITQSILAHTDDLLPK